MVTLKHFADTNKFGYLCSDNRDDLQDTTDITSRS